jgi:ABC-type dipeptide/oligopeptide/nickel transport system permease component
VVVRRSALPSTPTPLLVDVAYGWLDPRISYSR